jgi:hypothetical protein
MSGYDRSYAVTNPEGFFAAGRAEDPSFFTKILHEVQIFAKKEKCPMLPQANWAIPVRKRPVCRPTA